MRKYVILSLIITLFGFLLYGRAYASKASRIIYFSSPTCSTCIEITPMVQKVADENQITIVRFDITDEGMLDLLIQYGHSYNLSEESIGIVPTVFSGRRAFVGKDIRFSIKDILSNSNDSFIEIDTGEISKGNIPILGVLLSGMLNGINPCSISMVLFLLSLITVREKSKIICVGLSFAVGKFLMFLLMGIFTYKIMNYIPDKFSVYMKYIFVLFAAIMLIMNAYDAFQIFTNRVARMKLMLPKSLRHFNQDLLRGMKNALNNTKTVAMAGIIGGAITSLGEFLCTGQIYLGSIIAMSEAGVAPVYSTMLLVAYNIALIIPILVITAAIFAGRKTLSLSSFFTKNMGLVKTINCAFFLIVIFLMLNR